jgi:dipeptidyl aminopeptidase/acylaminoacyl peptidase
MKQLRYIIVATAIAAAIAAAAAGPAHAQGRRPMTLVDLAELPRALDPQISPDGRFVTYMLQRPDWSVSRLVPHIWRQDTGGGAPEQLTFGDSGEANARWAPDGATILFLRGGQIWLLPCDGGEPRALTRHVTGVASPTWSPDGMTIYFSALEPRTADERDRERLKDDVYELDEGYKQRHLWRVVVSTGAEQRITSGESTVLSFRLSRDGSRIALERAPSPLAVDVYRGEVWVMDANGDHARVLTHNSNWEDGPELSPDNSQVLFLADMNAQFEPYYNTTLFVMPAGGGTPKPVLPDSYSFDRATWAPDGKSIIAVINMGVHNEIFQVDVSSGRAKQLTDGEHSIPATPAPAWAIEPRAGKIVFLLETATRFGEVWTLATSGDAKATRVTHVYDALERDFALPRQEKVEWKSTDGTTVEGLLFYPIGYQAGTRYPLVVQLHGGPNEADRFGAGGGVLSNYFPVLAAKGYAVLRPNYRGSIGYGNTAYRDIVGGYFKNMHLDVMTGVDYLIKQGIADPDRLVLTGWSAGGHLVNKLITFTDRFKAAVSGAGMANWISMYGQTDARSNRTISFGGTPWQKNAPIDVYWNNSPLKEVANVKTPTIFFVGESDTRVPLAQSEEMFRALRSNGVPTHLYVAPREPHAWSELRHNLYKANAELEWFEKYATGRVYVWEKAPGDKNPDKPEGSER